MTTPSSLTMEDAHRICAATSGELSLALVRGKRTRVQMEKWIRDLRLVADGFEMQLGAKDATGGTTG